MIRPHHAAIRTDPVVHLGQRGEMLVGQHAFDALHHRFRGGLSSRTARIASVLRDEANLSVGGHEQAIGRTGAEACGTHENDAVDLRERPGWRLAGQVTREAQEQWEHCAESHRHGLASLVTETSVHSLLARRRRLRKVQYMLAEVEHRARERIRYHKGNR